MPRVAESVSRAVLDPAFVMRRFIDLDVPMHVRDVPFRLEFPLQQLSIFCRHYDTGEALSEVPHYAIAQIGLPQIEKLVTPMLAEADIDPLEESESRTEFLRGLAPFRQTLTYPLGQIVTDHAGYASFDLTPLRHESVHAKIAELLGPLARELTARAANSDVLTQALAGKKPAVALTRLSVLPFLDPVLVVDALEKGDLAPAFVALRLELTDEDLAERSRDRRGASMQNPNILDWRLSPGSFTMSGAAVLGEDGCETLLPTNLSTQQFRFRQVIRIPGKPRENEKRNPAEKFKLGYVAEYVAEWFPIGHSLGQILYSLPLAPGEKVKIAVVDWARHERADRDEKTTFMEQLQHSELRDRSLTETVAVALREWQSGDSIMGGAALSAGAAVPLGAVSLGAGLALSLGASSASLDGGRDVTGETTQKISDAFQQASTAVRELKSTVVVQSDQSEKSNVQTRVIANYNHSHALTMLYYEVLRHYRVITRTVSIRPAFLVGFGGKPSVGMTSGSFSAAVLLAKRFLVEPALLDPKLASAFDATARVALGESKLARETAKRDAAAVTVDPGAKEFVKLIAQFTTTDDDTSEPVFVALVLTDGRTFEFQCDDAGAEGTSPEFEKVLPVPVLWKQIRGIEVKLKDINDGGDWEETNILITMATSANERVSILADAATRTLDDEGGATGLLTTVAPPASTTTKPGAEPQRVDFVSAEDDFARDQLIAHFNENRGHYLRLLRLAEDPNERVAWLGAKKFKAHQLLEVIENRALEIFGDTVAYPISAAFEDEVLREFGMDPIDRGSLLSYIEQLTSLPTRGVFGEAKLGHCNASEIIDTNRFWDWQQSPIPDDAPGISGADAGSRKDKIDGLTPTSFPQSIVNIATPQALPDPTGLGGAFGLLSALGPFKDITGQKELGPLLQTLSNNATSLASQGLKAANTKRLMDMVSSSPELKPEQKKQLIQSLLTGAVESEKQAQSNAASLGKPAEATSPVGSGSGASAGGSTPPTGGAVGTTPPTGTPPVGGTGTATGGASAGGNATASSPAPAKAPKKPATPVKLPQEGLVFNIDMKSLYGADAFGRMDLVTVTYVDESPPDTFKNVPLVAGGATIHATKVIAGHVQIRVTQQTRPFDNYLEQTFSVGGGKTPPGYFERTLLGSNSFKPPEKGNVIEVYASPRVKTEKVTAKSGKEAAQKIGATFGATGSVVSLGFSAEDSTTTTTGVDREFPVDVLVPDLASGYFILDVKTGPLQPK